MNIQNTKYKILNTKYILMGLGIFLIVLILGIFIAVRNEIPFPNAQVLGDKNYPAFATVSFTVKLNDPSTGSGQAKKLSLIRKALAANDKKVGAAILYGKNQKSDAKIEMVQKDSDTYVITAKNNKFFKAGKYTLAVTLTDFGNSRVLTQNFTWGVLAVNVNKSIYNPNEKANLFFSVLDESGANDCYALLRLEIKAPDGQATVLSSENGKIKRSKDCQGDNVTYQPDYFATYQTSAEGTYKMTLKSITKNGIYEIKDYFKVAANQDFEVERQTATRINPVSPYKVVLKIKANKNFEGKIIESLPYAFGAKADNGGKVEFDKDKYTHTITWNETMQKGQTMELTYEFKAPEISPEFYLLGPLQMFQSETKIENWKLKNENSLVFQETRYWQIAADPTNLILLWDPANGATPSGWTCISCSTGDPFFQTFIRGNSTYGGTGGNLTETPTVATLTVGAESAADATAKASGNAASGDAHTHTASNPTIGSGGIVPTFKSLMVIRYNSGIPSGASAIPANAIAFFDATVPTGWTRYSAQDGKYVRGDWTGTAGGSNTQTHTITWQSLAAASTAQDVSVANGGTSAASAHTHTAPSQTSTASINIEPPNITTILGTANATTSIPNAMIGMFDGAPGTSWTLKSNTGGDPFYQTFPKPSVAYGTTGGTTTHSHATETSGASGAPSATTTNGAGALTVADPAHTHTENVTFNTGSVNVPPYTDAIFAQKVFSISGTVRQSNESTTIGNPPCDSITGVIDIRINGGTATTVSCSSVDSTYTATPGTVVTGDVITILLNASSTPKANTILKAGSVDAASVDLYQNVVAARSDDTTAISNANICTFTTSMLFSCSTNAITVNSGIEFHVSSGTYTAGATLTTQGTGNLHVASGATGTLDTATNTIANNITIDSTGTLNINANTAINGGNITVTGTLNTTAGTPTITISGTGSISGVGNATFYALTTSGTGTTTYSASGTNTINHNLTVGSGTTLNINSSMTVTGNLANTTTGIINTTSGTPTVTVNGSTIGGGSGAITFYNLTTGGTTTFSGNGTNTINHNLIVNAGSLTISNPLTITGTGNVNTGATLNINANLTVNGGALTTTTTGIINTTAGTPTLTMSGTGSLGGGSGTITLYNLTTSGTGTTTFSGSSTNTINNNVSVGAGTTLNINSSVSITGSLTNTTSGVISTSAGTPTVTVSGTTIGGGTTGAITFYALTKAGAGTTTFTNGGTNTINNNLSVSAGTFVQSSILTITGDGSVSTGATLTIGANLTVNGGALTTTTTGIIEYSGTPTLTMSGTGSLGGGSGAISFYNLTTSGTGTTTFSGSGTNTVANNVNVGTGTTLNLNSNITITGNLTNTTTGIIGTTTGTPTVTVNGSTVGGGSGAITIYNLTVGIAGSVTFSGAGTNTINNNFTVNAGTTLSVNNNISIAGSFTNTTTGIITYSGTPTVTMTGTSKNLGGGSGTVTLYNLTVSGSTTIASAITVTNDLTNNGTTSGTSNITVNGSIAGTGTVNMTGGTVEQRIALAKNFGTTSGTGNWTFATLIFSNSTGGGLTVTTQTGGSGSVTASTLLQVGKSGDTGATTLNAGNRNWIISGTGTPISFIGSSTITAATSTFTYQGTGSINLANISYYSLATNGSGTYLPAASPLTATNNISVNSGTLSLGTNNLNVGSSSVTNSGGISVAGTLSQTSGTITIVGSSAGTATIGGAGTITFYNLSFLPTVASAPTFTLGSAASQTITINNDLTIGNGTNAVTVTAATNNPIIDINGSLSIAASGTLTAPPSATFTIAKNMTNNGTFNANGGTVTFDTTNTSTFAGSATPAITFNNFTSIIPNKILSFTTSKTFRIDGLFTVTGAVSNRVNIQSTTGTQWLINLQGTSAVTYSTITNSGCAVGTLNVTVDATNQDGGNNSACWLFTLSTVNSKISGNTRISGSLRFK